MYSTIKRSTTVYCSVLPLQENCVMTYNGSRGTFGTYAVALTLEDYPAGTTNFSSISPFSAVGIQFLVKISNQYHNGSCDNVPVFTASTPKDGECFEVQIGSAFRAVIEVTLADLSKQYVLYLYQHSHILLSIFSKI